MSESFSQLQERYEKHLQSLRKSESLLSCVRIACRDFARYCRDSLDVHQPTQLQMAHLDLYVRALQERRLKPNTVYSRQRVLRTWAAWLTLRGKLFINPFKDCAYKHPPHLPRGAPSEAQVKALLEAPPDDTRNGLRDRALFEFLYGTGLRIGELEMVDLRHLSLENREVQVIHGKGGRQRVLPVGPHLAAVLKDYLENTRLNFPDPHPEALFLNNAGGRLRRVCMSIYIRKYARDLGFSHFTCHSLRHAFATHMLQRGAPIVTVQRLLGHVTLQMTSHYTHLIQLDLANEFKRTHPRATKKRSRKPLLPGSSGPAP